LKKRLSIALPAILLFLQFSFSQEYSGTVNCYLKVLQVLGDRVKVVNAADLDSILPGDKVVLIQMTGGQKSDDAPPPRKDLYSGIQQCGKFEILQVAEVQKTPEYLVIFTDSVSNTYNNGEKIQLVRMLEGDKIIVDGTVTAREWDGSTGGIIAIIGTDTIDLKADIDASGSGFRGGQPENFSPVNCRTNATDTVNWTESETGRAGRKGEGIITVDPIYTKGTAEALNGGGSGYGRFSGGGGGSNYTYGGEGGRQSCISIGVVAEGGFNQLDYYRLFCNPSTRRIIMGGGGGAGTQDISDGRLATSGGDGGGIILLVTETLLGNGGVLKSNGQSVTDIASASGGGGGAGGTILIDAAAYSGTFTIEAKGGSGGNTGTNCTGAGGAGSGGILWHSGVQLFPGATVNMNYSAGARGMSDDGYCGTTLLRGGSGGAGSREDSLLLILNGFLFNTIRGNDFICTGQQPNLITGSSPKGGNGVYTYNWEQSPDGIDWTPATETPYGKNYQPPALNQTTYYRRTVFSEGIVDMSLYIKIHVYPTITGNTITGTDTICYNLTAGQLKGTIPPALSGGNESFAYKWLYSVNGTTWDTISQGNFTSADYEPGQLTATRHYRRYVQSTPYCSHTSNPVTVNVLSSITSNSFYSPDTTICQSLGPGKLNIGKPDGGDVDDYRFVWMQKSASSVWIVIPGANDTLYDPGSLDETMRYKRIVYSGNDDACIHTSAEKLVTVLDSISNNLIGIDPSRYCAGDNPVQIDGQTPGGGDIGNYVYQWQIRTSGAWSVIDGAVYESHTPQMVETNTDFRRLVSSGQLMVAGQYACHNTSPVLSLEVIPYITNLLELADQTLCQYNTPLPFEPDTATGGYGNIAYQWIAREEGSALWNNATGTATLSTYVPGPLEKTTYFARKASSDICIQISDTITVTVYPVIRNNIIAGTPAVYTCLNTGKALSGPGYSGGKAGDYAFLWEQSTDNIDWNPATGSSANYLADFETSVLTDSLLLRRILYSSSAGKECSNISAPVTVRINSLPSGDVVSSVDTLCTGESLDIRFNVSGEHGPWDITVGEGEFRGSKDNFTETSGSIPLEFDQDRIIRMLEIRDDSLCYAETSTFSNEVVVKVYGIHEALAGPDDEVCGSRYTLNAEAPPPSCKGWWTVQDGFFVDNDSTKPVAVVEMNPGIYGMHYMIWTVTDTNRYCPDWDTIGVMFYEKPVEIDADANANTQDTMNVITLEFRYTTPLNADTTGLVGTGHWKVLEGTGIISNDTLWNATITELSTNNLIRWTIINGICPELKDSVEIIVNPLEVPKGFSPNGDLVNDEFVVPYAENADRIAIKIFTRTGVLVFESDDYTNGELWKGTGKNDLDLPEGTYFYVMDIWVKGKTEPVNFKSFVEILR
jgi:gliding motility-associated-like protein